MSTANSLLHGCHVRLITKMGASDGRVVSHTGPFLIVQFEGAHIPDACLPDELLLAVPNVDTVHYERIRGYE